MHTYLPYMNFAKCAKVLEPAELRESIETVVKVFDVLHETPGVRITHTRRHPAVAMWRGHETWLHLYGATLLEESPRVKSAWRLAAEENLAKHLDWFTSGSFSMEPPLWLGEERFHNSQRAALMYRDPDAYCPKFPGTKFMGEDLYG